MVNIHFPNRRIFPFKQFHVVYVIFILLFGGCERENPYLITNGDHNKLDQGLIDLDILHMSDIETVSRDQSFSNDFNSESEDSDSSNQNDVASDLDLDQGLESDLLLFDSGLVDFYFIESDQSISNKDSSFDILQINQDSHLDFGLDEIDMSEFDLFGLESDILVDSEVMDQDHHLPFEIVTPTHTNDPENCDFYSDGCVHIDNEQDYLGGSGNHTSVLATGKISLSSKNALKNPEIDIVDPNSNHMAENWLKISSYERFYDENEDNYLLRMNSSGQTVGAFQYLLEIDTDHVGEQLHISYKSRIVEYRSGEIRLVLRVNYTDGSTQTEYIGQEVGVYPVIGADGFDYSIIDEWQDVQKDLNFLNGGENVDSITVSLYCKSLDGIVDFDKIKLGFNYEETGEYLSPVYEIPTISSQLSMINWSYNLYSQDSYVKLDIRSSSSIDMSEPTDWVTLIKRPSNIRSEEFLLLNYFQFRLRFSLGSAFKSPLFNHITFYFRENSRDISGVVLNSQSNKPISNAKIFDGVTSVFSDENGSFLISTDMNREHLYVTYPGFLEKRIEISESQDNLTIELDPLGSWPVFRMNLHKTGNTPIQSQIETTPGIKWKFELSTSKKYRKVYLSDITGDGKNELLIIYENNISAFDEKMHLLWTTQYNNEVLEVKEIIGVVDMDLDGTVEIIYGSGSDDFSYTRGYIGILSGNSGDLLWKNSNSYSYIWTFDLGKINSDGYLLNKYNVKIVDLDKDGFWELIAHSSFNKEIQVFDFDAGVSNGYMSYSSDDTLGYSNYNYLIASGDIFGDESLEIIKYDTEDFYLLSSQAEFLNDLDLDEIARNSGGSIVFSDIDQDQKDEIIFTHKNGLIKVLSSNESGELGLIYETYINHQISKPDGFISNLTINDSSRNLIFSDENSVYLYDLLTGEYERILEDGKACSVLDINHDEVADILVQKDHDAVAYSITEEGSDLEEFWRIHSARLIKSPITQRKDLSGEERFGWVDSFTYEYSIDSDSNSLIAFTDLSIDGNDLSGKKIALFENIHTRNPTFVWEFEHDTRMTLVNSGNFGDQKIFVFNDEYGRLFALNHEGNITYEFSPEFQDQVPLVADLDGNGSNEIILFGESTNILDPMTGDQQNSPELSELNNFDRIYRPTYAPYNESVIWDLDGDRNMEIILMKSRRLHVYDHLGNLLWNSNIIGDYFTIGKFNYDNIYDIVVNDPSEKKFYTLNGIDGSVISVDGLEHEFDSGILTAVDLNHDNIDDIISKHTSVTAFAIDGLNGNEIWNNKRNGMCFNGLPIALNIKNNLDVENIGPEILITGGASVTGWSSVGAPLWTIGYETETAKNRYGAATDINQDGYSEIIQPTSDGIVYAFELSDVESNYLNPLWVFELESKSAISDITIADIDSDMMDEAIFGAGNRLIAINTENGSILWEYNFPYTVHHPIIADVDQDRFGEILVSSGKYLYCLDTETHLDLSIDRDEVFIEQPSLEDGLNPVVVYVRNLGGVVGDSVEISLSVNDIVIESAMIEEIMPGEAKKVIFHQQIPSSPTNMRIEISSEHHSEVNLENNSVMIRLNGL